MTEQDFKNGQVLLIDKPLNWTSFQVVNKIRWLIKKQFGIKKIKVGHAGTLDPLATGLLILCTGKFTKKIEALQAQEKEYTGTFTLGATTPSYDLETEIDHRFDITEITSENMFIEREKKTIGFSGNVILKQGSSYLTADQIELFFDDSFSYDGFYKMSASGNILIKNNDSTSRTGNFATYNVSDEKIIITENVVLKNQMSMINGNKLILDINSGKIEIFDDKLDQERVKGVLVDQSNKGEQ